MNLITALELAGNYPENILILSAKQECGKFSGFCYMTRDSDIHKLMLSTTPVFDTGQEAEDALHEIAVQCKKEYGDKDIFQVLEEIRNNKIKK